MLLAYSDMTQAVLDDDWPGLGGDLGVILTIGSDGGSLRGAFVGNHGAVRLRSFPDIYPRASAPAQV